MKKMIAEPLFIFVSIISSLWVNGYSDDLKKKKALNSSIVTLSTEISSNISYSEEHLIQLQHMHHMTDYILNHFNTYNREDLRDIHDNNPFVHSFSVDNEIVYDKTYSDFNDKKYFMWTNAWEPDNIFFTSLLNSGELLKINNELLVREIESIYTKQEERLSGLFNFRNSVGNKIIDWDVNRTITLNTAQNSFFSARDKELMVHMQWRKDILEQSIKGLEDYIVSLNRVVELIDEHYKAVQ